MTHRLSREEIKERIKTKKQRDKLFEVYALSLFVGRAFFSQDFEPSLQWGEDIKLTKSAEEYLENARNAGLKTNKVYEAFALFQLFYHHDLFIDFQNINTESILSLLNEMHRSGQVKWAYIFGNQLYHKFNDLNPSSETDSLIAEHSEELLDGTPQGVFQVGKYISGPLGFLKGKEERLLPPTLKMTLWHCSDPGCRATHQVSLLWFKSPFQTYKNSLIRYILDTFGPPSDWHKPLLLISREKKWIAGRPYSDLPSALGERIIGKERSSLMIRCLSSQHNKMLISTIKNSGKNLKSPSEVAEKLSPEEQHQLLLLIPDLDLIRFIDELIVNKEIKIPPSELRTHRSYAYGPPKDTYSQVSSLGISSIGHPPIVELGSIIWSTYESLNLVDELEWLLRGHKALTIRHSVIDYIRTHGPQKTTKDLIFSSRAVTGAIGERLNFQFFDKENEDITIKRLLWKFGFMLPRYEETYQIIKSRIEEFRTCVLKLGPELKEPEKAEIRSIGVNLFVAAESFLEDLICFNVWLLSSDHFTGTRFRYKKVDAQKAIIATLGEKIISGNEAFEWDVNGVNSLGTLLAYLQEYRNWVKNRPDAEKEPIVRKEKDFPHYAKDTVWIFPFKHTELWADISPEIMASYADILNEVCSQLGQAELASIRNGLDHKREDETFPSTDKMIVCMSRLKEAVELSDSKRLIPKLFWCVSGEMDGHGNTCYTFADYKGTTVSLWDPPFVLAGFKKSFGEPYLIAPFDFFCQPNTMLMFKITSKSEYSEYWKNYPRRRYIPPLISATVQDLAIDDMPNQLNSHD
jgi:hypothetical protein